MRLVRRRWPGGPSWSTESALPPRRTPRATGLANLAAIHALTLAHIFYDVHHGMSGTTSQIWHLPGYGIIGAAVSFGGAPCQIARPASWSSAASTWTW